MLYRNYLKSKYQNTAVKLANAEGVPCVLEYSKGKNMRNYEVYGNSYQATISGKNLFDKSISTNTDIVNETTIANTSYSLPILDNNAICDILKPNTTYTISCEFECTTIPSEDDGYTYSNGTLGFIIYTKVSGYSSIDIYIDKQMSVGEVYQFSKTFKTPETFDSNGNYSLLVYRNKYTGSKAIGASMICRNIQIEEGSTATEYEPYGVSPSPDYPSEVQSVGDLVTDTESEYYGKYDIPITVKGKNLISSLPYYYPIPAKNFNVVFEAGKTYTFSFESSTSSKWRLMIWGTELDGSDLNIGSNEYLKGAYVSQNAANRLQNAIDVTTNSYSYVCNKAFIAIRIAFWNTDNGSDDTFVNPQLEEGTTATAYETYKGSITEHIYLDEPLRKVGDYADYIDFKNQKVVRKVKEKQLVGAEQWSRYPTFKGFYSGISDMLIQNNGYGFCSHYPRTTKPENMGVRFGVNNIVAYFTQLYTDENPLTTDEWKAKLAEWNASGNPLKVTYILAESTEENIALPALKTFKGTSVMSVDTAVFPTNIKAKYIRT